MNDFTKEELEIIIEAMNRLVEFITVWDEPKHFDVISKIQSLIDNYCDHKNKSGHYGYEPIDICDNCGIICYEKL